MEMEFIVICRRSACKNAAVMSLQTCPFLIKLGLMAPNFSNVEGSGARTACVLLLVSIPNIKVVIYSAQTAISKNEVKDSKVKVGHQTSFNVQGMVSSKGGRSLAREFMNGILFYLICWLIYGLQSPYPSIGSLAALLRPGLLLLQSLKP